MLTQEHDVEIHALAARGWTSPRSPAHGPGPQDGPQVPRRRRGPVRERAASCLEPLRGYIDARFVDDPHLPAVTLLDELAAAGFNRSYPTLVRELRRTELRPVCLVCQHRRGTGADDRDRSPAG